MREFAVGVDIGGTNIKAGVVGRSGNLLASLTVPTQRELGPHGVLERVARFVEEVLHSSGLRPGDLVGVGVGVAALTDMAAGVVAFAPNLGWENIPARDVLAARLGMNVFVDNDANVAALGEVAWGAGRGARVLVYFTVATGIGGAIVFDGRLYRGVGGFAGELGHMTLVEEGPRCGCGNRGCLESLAAAPAMVARARAAVARGRETRLMELAGGDAEKITAELVFEAARRGDGLAQEIVEGAVRYLGMAVASVVNILNPDVVVIGGGVSRSADVFLDRLREVAAARWLAPAGRDVRIVQAALGIDAGVLGAGALVFAAEGRAWS